ncbi:MAG: response regulator [Candidatus Omnitrophica bacterium]|nr:response regulator [Candidatus Omnitrophota bacterium]
MGKKILIIDDDIELGEEVAETLRDEGYSATNVSEPDKGEKLIDKDAFDIIIVDYKLPGSNGIDFLRKIKQKNPKVNVFIASGRPFIEEIIEKEKVSHLLAGIIHKPFNSEVLLEKIKDF